MSVRFPDGWRIEDLNRAHARSLFDCGVKEVNDWLRTKARQSRQKHLSSTKVLLDETARIAGFYTLAWSQVHLDQLPHEIARRLPRQLLPVAVIAWLGVDRRYRGRGLGDRLLAHALLQCHRASQVIPFVAVVPDCLNADAKAFFLRHDFAELPGHPMKLLLPKALLDALVTESD